MNRTVSSEGTIVAHLAQNTKKATPTGDKELTAGAIVILDDADDVPASATRKWAGESGADVTGGHTAANITSQGALATKDTVAAAEIDAGAVTGPKLGADAVDGTKLADNAIGNEHLGAGVVDTAELAADAVDDTKIANDAIGNEHMQGGAIDTAELFANAVTTPKIAASNITFALMAADSVRADEIKTQSINGAHFVETVIDEFQSVDMGSSLSDAQFDALTT